MRSLFLKVVNKHSVQARIDGEEIQLLQRELVQALVDAVDLLVPFAAESELILVELLGVDEAGQIEGDLLLGDSSDLILRCVNLINFHERLHALQVKIRVGLLFLGAEVRSIIEFLQIELAHVSQQVLVDNFVAQVLVIQGIEFESSHDGAPTVHSIFNALRGLLVASRLDAEVLRTKLGLPQCCLLL